MSSTQPALSPQGELNFHGPVVEYAVLRPAAGKVETGLDFIRLTATLCSLAATENRSEATFRILRCVEEPELCLLTGVWPSLDWHHKWIASERNQQLLERAKSAEVDIVDFFHYSSAETQLPSWFDAAPIIAIGLQYPYDAAKLSAVLANNRHTLSASTGDRVAGGWRIESADPPTEGFPHPEQAGNESVQQRDEWVQLSGWNTVEDHHDFARAHPEYSENVRNAVWAFKLKHWKKLQHEE